MYKYLAAIPLAALLSTAAPLAAQDEEPVEEPSAERCVSIVRIRSTEIIDDRNVLFHMRGGDIYHNILANRCPGLARENRFSYETSLNRLCQLDWIAVLYSEGGSFREGPRCGLGLFHPITAEDAEALREGKDAGPEPEALPMPEPEEVGAGGTEAGDEEEIPEGS
ncbi:MAG: hypothetical protein OEV41_08730 [Gammaproteobacteria bacterium]|nr:hypothetical protein [Gammaproteobacteria bacterium]MDH5345200.1 hypothetical protein [Gammaproteobacteria bacterium]